MLRIAALFAEALSRRCLFHFTEMSISFHFDIRVLTRGRALGVPLKILQAPWTYETADGKLKPLQVAPQE